MLNFPSEPPNWCIPPDDGPQPPEDVKGSYYINYNEKMSDGTPCAVIGYEINDYGVHVSDNFGILVHGSSKLCEEYGVKDSEAEKHLYLLTFRNNEPLIDIHQSPTEWYHEEMILISDSLESLNNTSIDIKVVLDRMSSYEGMESSLTNIDEWVYEDFAEQWEPEDLSGGPEDGPDPWDEAYW